eukprot:3524058-Pleurochrysis_carterae.AAC.1
MPGAGAALYLLLVPSKTSDLVHLSGAESRKKDAHCSLARLVVLYCIVHAEDAVGRQRDGVGYDTQPGHARLDWCRRIEGEDNRWDDSESAGCVVPNIRRPESKQYARRAHAAMNAAHEQRVDGCCGHELELPTNAFATPTS